MITLLEIFSKIYLSKDYAMFKSLIEISISGENILNAKSKVT